MRFWLVILVMVNIHCALAIDFGKRAQSFGINEEPFIVMMMRKLQNQDLEANQKKMQELVKEKVTNPSPVAGVKPATKDREFYHDPTYELQENIFLPCGKLLHKAGTRVNPLEYMKLERRIFFIDAREQKQIEWIKEQLAAKGSEALAIEDKIILVGGSVFTMQDILKEAGLETAVYFDQFGELTKKWGITASPAIAQQENMQLKINEVCLNDDCNL